MFESYDSPLRKIPKTKVGRIRSILPWLYAYYHQTTQDIINITINVKSFKKILATYDKSKQNDIGILTRVDITHLL